MTSHPIRGFAIVNNNNNAPKIEVQVRTNLFDLKLRLWCVKFSNFQEIRVASQRPVWFVFAGMGTQWAGMGRDLLGIPVFHESILRSDTILQAHNVPLYDMIAQGDAFDDILNSFVAIAAIQVALVDVLTSVGVKADGIVGHSVGELGCAYADGSLSAEEVVLAAYWRGRCVKDAKLEAGAMAAVGLTWQEAKDRCPEGVVPACHNAVDTVTISGKIFSSRPIPPSPYRFNGQRMPSNNVEKNYRSTVRLLRHSLLYCWRGG